MTSKVNFFVSKCTDGPNAAATDYSESIYYPTLEKVSRIKKGYTAARLRLGDARSVDFCVAVVSRRHFKFKI